MTSLTAAEIGAFLGISASGVRQIIRRAGIAPVGKVGRALTYRPSEVLAASGVHDRRAS